MLLFGKIQNAKYISDMYANEYLYFKSLRDFRSKEIDPSGRFDPRELNLKNEQLTYLSVNTGFKEIELSKILSNFKGQFTENLSEPKINCCSLHTIEIEIDKSLGNIDNKVLEMGNKMLLIHDFEPFFKILDYSLEELGYTYSRKLVTYYDPKSYNGDLTLHHKDEIYRYQNEYRILIAPTDNKPIKIPLPGLKKISTVIDSNMISTIRLKTEPNKS